MSKTKVSLRFISVLILTVCARVSGEGGPPVIGDDPGTPGNGHWEINIACIGLRMPRQSTIETPHIDLNYGLGDHLELKYEVGFLSGRQDGQSWTSGINNSLLGVKYRFFDKEKNGVDMSIYPQIAVNTSRYLGTAGLADRGTNEYLPIELAKTFGKWELNGEAGFQFNPTGPNQLIGGPIVGYQLTKRIELLGEARVALDDHFRRTDVIFDAGARVVMNDNLAIIFAVGRSIRNNDQSTTLYAYAGCRVTF